MKYIMLAALLTTVPAAAPAPPADRAVTIARFAYSPRTLTVRVGETVRFVNRDDEAHTVTAKDGSFDSTGLDTGDAWSHTFTKSGTFVYFCSLHPWMKATVIVKPSAGGQS